VVAPVSFGSVPGSNFAAVWDEIARAEPDRTALVAGDRRVSWAELADRAHHLAWYLHHDASLVPGDRVAIALTSRPEYLETFYAALAIRCVPVNVNPRATTDELRHALDDSDAKVVIHEAEAAKTVRTAARRIPKPWRPQLLEVGEPYEQALATATPPGDERRGDGPLAPPDGNDLIFVYAGGSGMPKAVMWRNDDLYRGLTGKQSGVVLPVAPLTHSTGLFSAIGTLSGGGTVVLLDSPRFDPVLVWSTVERERVETLTIVGDAGARPLLGVLDAGEHSWDLSSLHAITSSGAAFSPDITRRLVAHFPQVAVVGSLHASEGAGALSVNERVAVLGEESMQPVLPGSDEIGLLAKTGFMPVAYWKDAARTASTFRVIDGTRYVISGEYATVDGDGRVHLIGRANASINTTRANVRPEHVEPRLVKHASVQDCAVVGVPGERSGERIVALVVVVENHYIDEAELTAWCRTKLASHEAPERFLFVDTLHRSPSGKVNHSQLRELALEILERELG
jgi:acyl-CoA synthetase (AMP-forming)/AMP-acid ligase II